MSFTWLGNFPKDGSDFYANDVVSTLSRY